MLYERNRFSVPYCIKETDVQYEHAIKFADDTGGNDVDGVVDVAGAIRLRLNRRLAASVPADITDCGCDFPPLLLLLDISLLLLLFVLEGFICQNRLSVPFRLLGFLALLC